MAFDNGAPSLQQHYHAAQMPPPLLTTFDSLFMMDVIPREPSPTARKAGKKTEDNWRSLLKVLLLKKHCIH
jgi:hypothetical protein